MNNAINLNTQYSLEILYIEDDPAIAEIYSAMIKEIMPACKVTVFQKGCIALEEIKNFPQRYSLIIADYKLDTVNGADLFKFVSSQMLGIPFIILSGLDCSDDPKFKDFFNSHVRNAFLVKPIDIENFEERIKWCLQSEKNLLKIYQKQASNNDEKIAVNSAIFLKLNIIPFNVFLKLNDGKFVKIINKAEIFESSLIKKLLGKGVVNFYVNRSELTLYSHSVNNSLNMIIKTKKKNMDEIQKSQLAYRSLEIIKNNLLQCGFSKTLLQTSDEIINIQIELIENNPDMQIFLKKFQSFNKSNSEQTRLVCYILVTILKDLQWDSESTVHRMCLAGILHDITLPDNFIKKNAFKVNLNELSEEEQNIYLRHPEEASHLAKNFEMMTGGIEQYILEHHELPDGKGFPRKLNFNQVHPLSAVLHISDYVAHLFWDLDFNQEEILEHLKEQRPYYARGFYRKPYEAIYRMLKLNWC